ncbi:hypothetical protein QVD17_37394 [Tagetes erecta]|uniref:Wall-associated receptor kinase galacturonan-binding domain-containing protein n=1 Tax=Tagetes erecta TaxID=13708 RepID=A0AAD8NK00_TARER|nr:hypothetical protein QVD17_37394 [Tagetes erecta]
MKSFQAYLHLLIFLSLAATSTARYAKTGCNDTCGNNVSIPYPFGIGAGCSVNEWYIVECNSSTPYLSSLNRLEILSVNVENLIVTVRMQKSFVCLDSNKNLSRINNWSVDLNRSPFLFSKLHNNFVFDGCGYSAMRNNVSSIPGCVTSCNNATLNDTLSDQNCVGFRCCQAAIPSHLKSYAVTFTLDVDGVDGAFCWYSFLMDKTSIDQRRLSDPFVPVSLVWTLAASDQVTCCDNRTRYMRKVDVFDSTPVDTWQCDGRWSSKGTPYLVDGCDEQEEPTAECRECEKGGGVCDQNTTYYIDGSVFNQKVACYYNGEKRKPNKTSLGVILERRFMSIVDSVVIKDGTSDELLMVANLAMRCLNFSGKYRPTMKEVAVELETIRASHIPNRIQTNIRYVRREEELSMSTYGESSTTFLSFNDSITK